AAVAGQGAVADGQRAAVVDAAALIDACATPDVPRDGAAADRQCAAEIVVDATAISTCVVVGQGAVANRQRSEIGNGAAAPHINPPKTHRRSGETATSL